MKYSSTAYRIKMSLRDCRLRPALKVCLFEEEYCLDLFGFMLALPFMDRWHREPYEMMESWGVYYDSGSVVLCWGRHCKFIHMPWDWVHIGVWVERPDGSWVPYVATYDEGKVNKKTGKVMEPDGRHVEKYSYEYKLRSGEIQRRVATLYTERREWRQWWLQWTPLFAKVRTSIDIHFSDEVGEGTGSWKGGCVGTGYDRRPGETMEQALRRMERERKF